MEEESSTPRYVSEEDPYAYTKRSEFTSENFKIDIKGLPKFFSVGQLKKLLNGTLDLACHKVKPHGYQRTSAYVNFRDEAARDNALSKINGHMWKNNVLSAKEALPAKDPLLSFNSERKHQSHNPNDNLSVSERLTLAVTPFAQYSNEEQLEKKISNVKETMRNYGFKLAVTNFDLKSFVSWNQKHRYKQICEIENIRPSPVTEDYRNKCEFTVGINPETNVATVGFRLDSYKGGSVSVGNIDHLKHLPIAMKSIVKVFQDYIRKSGLEPFNPVDHKGTWRQLTCRTTSNHDLLIVVMIHPQDFSKERLKEEKEKLVKYFTDEEQQHKASVTSIYFYSYAQRERGSVDEYEHLWGKKVITETICGINFRVSPSAFLQVNTPGCEVLYKTIGELAEVSENTVVLDICCGTGTIGLSLANKCKQIVGVDIISEAISDARYNARSNDITNATFYDGKAEDHINIMLETNQQHSCVAIVDPPRAGLHKSVICALRKAENIKRLVFASCDPKAAMQNFLDLGRPTSKTYRGAPFVPIRAIPVDMFPHTPHYELLVLFERYDVEKWDKIISGNPQSCDQEMYDRILTNNSTFKCDTAKSEKIMSGTRKQANDDVIKEEQNNQLKDISDNSKSFDEEKHNTELNSENYCKESLSEETSDGGCKRKYIGDDDKEVIKKATLDPAK